MQHVNPNIAMKGFRFSWWLTSDKKRFLPIKISNDSLFVNIIHNVLVCFTQCNCTLLVHPRNYNIIMPTFFDLKTLWDLRSNWCVLLKSIGGFILTILNGLDIFGIAPYPCCCTCCPFKAYSLLSNLVNPQRCQCSPCLHCLYLL
jgi:hypothetical protein